MSDLDEIQTSVLLTTFTSKKKRYKVFFHQNKIVWDREKQPFDVQTVPVENVISVKNVYLEASHPLDDPILVNESFTIHYAERANNLSNWKLNSIIFTHSDPLQVSTWVKTLQSHLQTFTHRPKQLLLFINPFGGRKNAMKIYEKTAKPLFQIAGVEITVNVSQRKDQIRDYVAFNSLDMFDSVGCVGGDGTLSELFNGLVMRECRLQQVDLDDMSQELPKPNIPIGVIPGGSTDTIAYCMHGTTDIATAVLHIILGDRLGLDLVSVYDENKMLRLYASVLSYGYLGDIAHHSDRHRWMGPRRYDYSGFKKIIANKGYEGEIAILSSDAAAEESKCYENCLECSPSMDSSKLMGSSWRTIKGKYFMVSGANISCACTRSPNGIAPYSHLGNGNLHLVLVKHTSLLNNIKLLLTISGKKKGIKDLPFVEIHEAKEFCFRAIHSKSRWNCDGEVQNQTNIRAKVQCKLLTVFSRGMPKPNEQAKSVCCKIC